MNSEQSSEAESGLTMTGGDWALRVQLKKTQSSTDRNERLSADQSC